MTKKYLFSWLLKKAILMVLWTKAGICGKVHFTSKSCQEHQAGKNIISVNPVILPALEFRRRGSNLSSCLRGEKIREISVNSWLINDLRAYKSLYNCKETFTDVMSPLQIRLFMQNEPNFRKSQMNVNKVLTRDYEKRTLGEHGKNEPKTNPNEPN